MDVGIVWPTPFPAAGLVPSMLSKLRASRATHLRLNLDHRIDPRPIQVLPILDLDYVAPDVPAYLDFCERVVAMYQFPIVEILNEPYTLQGWTARQYGALAEATLRRLQPYRPHTKFAIAGDFLRADRKGPRIDGWLTRAKIPWALVDYVAVHPYREPGRPSVSRYGTRANEYAEMQRQFFQVPLLVTEVGWNLAEVDEATQAVYVAEELTINEACGIAATYIYAHVSEMMTGFGMLRQDQTARPIVTAVAQFQEARGR